VKQRDTRTREQAIKDLIQCDGCGRWITIRGSCDSCWVDNHRCPPTLDKTLAMLNRAMELGAEATVLAAKLKLAAGQS
jgi:hypothetical protein